MKQLTPTNQPLLQQITQIIQAQQLEAYLVGGAVRDLLLGRDIVDLDFALPNDGLAAARRVANALGAAFYALDPARGTGRVVCNDPSKSHLDFATFRGPTLEADLNDRDFTINAMALSLTDPPQLIDPLHGRRDLETGQIRAVSANSLKNDPARVLRAIRQATQFGFSIETQTGLWLREAAPMLKEVSPERQRDELLKLLNTPAPGQAMQLLRYFEVWPHFLPEVTAMSGVDQSPPHYLDVFNHTAAALDAWAQLCQADFAPLPAALRPALRLYLRESIAGDVTRQELLPLALLLHDTGKSLTHVEETTGEKGLVRESSLPRVRFLGHERESATIARRVMPHFRFSSQAASLVTTIVAHHLRPLLLAQEGRVSSRATYRFFRDTAGGGVAVALHALADQQATYPPGQGQVETQAVLAVAQQLIAVYFEQHDQVVNPPPLLTGHDLIVEFGLPEGRLIGLLLGRLKEAQATGLVQTRTAAVSFVKTDPDFLRHNIGK